MLRSETASGSELGMLAKKFMDKGDLVPDSHVVEMIMRHIDDPTGVLLDGFPRNVAQAATLDAALEQSDSHVDQVVHMSVDIDELVRRLALRAICRDCQIPYNLESNPPSKTGICDRCGGEVYVRDDDKPEAVKNRMKVYHELTAPVLDYYQERSNVVDIAVSGTPDEVFEKLYPVIDLGTPSN
jgi:adenylate kinase